MGHVLLWVFTLASALLLIALVSAANHRPSKKWFRVQVPVVALLLLSAFSVAVLFGYGVHTADVQPTWFFGYFLSLSICYLVMSSIILYLAWRIRNANQQKRWPTRLLAKLFAIALLLDIAVFFIMDVNARFVLNSIEIEARTLNSNRTPPPLSPDENAHFSYTKAFDELSKRVRWLDLFGDFPEEATFDPLAPEAVEFLKNNEKTLTLLREATKVPKYRFETDYSDPFNMEYPSLEKVRNSTNLLVLSARHHAAKGRMTEALSDIHAARVLAARVASAPGLLSASVSVVSETIATDGLESVLATPGADFPKDYSIPPIENIPCEFLFEHVIRSESAFGLSALVHAYRNGLQVSPYRPTESSALRRMLVPFFRVFFLTSDINVYRDGIRRARDLTKKPYYMVKDEVDALPEDPTGQPRGLSRGYTDIVRARYMIDEARARHILANLALAVSTYHARTGNYPNSLKILVPEYIVEIPADPYDGKPMKMTSVDDGVILYSVWKDVVDDNGEEIVRSEGKGDITFCLGKSYVERRLEPALERKAK
jgi:hypothetical protein